MGPPLNNGPSLSMGHPLNNGHPQSMGPQLSMGHSLNMGPQHSNSHPHSNGLQHNMGPPHSNGPSLSNGPPHSMGHHPPPTHVIRSVLKRSGQRSRGYRVSFNESKNEILEADYVIFLTDETEPQIVSIRTLDLTGSPSSGGQQLTLSPPEGYKDVFGHHHHLISHRDQNSLDATLGWPCDFHDPHCPRANLPDLVISPTNLTVENVRNHDQLMLDSPQQDEVAAIDEVATVAKTGILKGGKFWKNGHNGSNNRRQSYETDERRSVRFSGRDEFTTLESSSSSPPKGGNLEMANQAALACFLSPKFQELTELLVGEQHPEDWNLELSPLALENALNNLDDVPHHYHSCAKHGGFHQLDGPKLNDEHISESVQRYDEMRRRIAVSEGRDNNSICSDESAKSSSSDSQSSVDSITTESKIRRLENADVAHVGGGIMRSNSEVRRAIERNALRRSLIRFAEARKKDTNKNDNKSCERHESTLLEKLKWLTASEDATNGNDKTPEEDTSLPTFSSTQQNVDKVPHQERSTIDEQAPQSRQHHHRYSIQQYRKLAEMFNKTTSLNGPDIKVPGDVREWKMDAELFKIEKSISQELDIDEMGMNATTYTAVPAVSVCEQISDEDAEKLIYSGGVRYTKEGTLRPATTGHKLTTAKGTTAVTRERTDEIDDALHDDRSSSVPSSSQSSPRLSGRVDLDGASTAESGYSSNETNSELGQMLPPELDELAEFVKQDAGRMERLRRRFDDPEDHGFNRRPSVKGIKPRFGSTTDLLNQMASQLAPPVNVSWPYKESTEDENTTNQQRRRGVAASTSRNNTPLPSLKEEGSYLNPVDPPPFSGANKPYGYRKPLRMYSGDLPPRTREEYVRHGQPPPQLSRTQSYTTLQDANHQYGGSNLVLAKEVHHYPTSVARRPASVHGHAPTDMLISGPQHQTPDDHRSFHQYNSRSHSADHSMIQENTHNMGSYSSNVSSSYNPGYYDHHQSSPVENDSCQQRNSYIERSYSQNWQNQPSNDINSSSNYVHSNSNNYPPIVSSQMSYTTTIVPESSNPRPSHHGHHSGISLDSSQYSSGGGGHHSGVSLDSSQYSSGGGGHHSGISLDSSQYSSGGGGHHSGISLDSSQYSSGGGGHHSGISLDSSQYSSGEGHHSGRDSGLILRQAMNVST